MKSAEKKVMSFEDFKQNPKERTYILVGNSSPLSLMINSRHDRRNPLLFFDPVMKIQRALRYCRNQPSVFVDEQDGNAILEHIVFDDGKLVVEAQNPVLQYFLHIHPGYGRIYKEYDHEEIAREEVRRMDLEDKARDAARSIDISVAESILRIYTTAQVDKMTSEEIKRDIRLLARQQPEIFLEAIEDPQLEISNTVSKLLDQGILTIKNGRDVHFNLETNKKKIFTIPMNDDPHDAIKAFFLTDEGLLLYKPLQEKVQ